MPDTKAPLRILLADDHLTMRHGLKLLIDSQPDMTVIAEASDGDSAVQGVLNLSPDIVVMDISMPGTNGLAATRTLKQLRPDAMYLALRLSAIRQDIRQRAGRVTGPIPIPHSKGFDFDSGFGFVDAATALRLTAGF